MDIKAELLSENSKNQWKKVVRHISENPGKFDELVNYFLGHDYRVAQRASNVVNLIAGQQPEIIAPYLDKMISNLENDIHDAVKRNTVRMLQFIDIPEEHLGIVADKCFRYLDSALEPVAVRAFSMQVLYNITCKVPELKDELTIMIEDHLPYGSAGYKSRAKKILEKLRQK